MYKIKIVFNFFGLILFLISNFSTYAAAHEDINFEYICSVVKRNSQGLFRDVVNVVFMPDWQRKSHLFSEEGKDIWFEIAPVKNEMGNFEKNEMRLSLYLNQSLAPTLVFYGPEYSEIGFQNQDLNIGAHCFHRSQRGK